MNTGKMSCYCAIMWVRRQPGSGRCVESRMLTLMLSTQLLKMIGNTRVEIMKKRLASEQDMRVLLNKEQRVIFDSPKRARIHR